MKFTHKKVNFSMEGAGGQVKGKENVCERMEVVSGIAAEGEDEGGGAVAVSAERRVAIWG